MLFPLRVCVVFFYFRTSPVVFALSRNPRGCSRKDQTIRSPAVYLFNHATSIKNRISSSLKVAETFASDLVFVCDSQSHDS